MTEALIYSLDLIKPSRDEPHYDVVYSYKVGEERYTGQFSDYYRGDSHSPLHVNGIISIRYCPEHPAKSYYPDAQPPAVSRWMLFAAMMAPQQSLLF